MSEEDAHRPVLLGAVLEALAVKPDGIYVDATFGRGGHSREILRRLGSAGRLYAIDRDPDAVQYARHALATDERFSVEQREFGMLAAMAQEQGIMGRVDGMLLDLGVSSPQLDVAERGFSFQHDGPLDMRMDPGAGISAADWLAGAQEGEIARVLREFGEERFARRIARAIVAERTLAPIRSTARLAEIVRRANPAWEKGKDPATRSFQALRIFLNRELVQLQDCLEQSLNVLAIGGRLAVISFHSLEDRIVKRFVRDHSRGDAYPTGVPVTVAHLRPRLRPIGKAMRPAALEVASNPRARSAVLRVAERLA